MPVLPRLEAISERLSSQRNTQDLNRYGMKTETHFLM
jgi:hypothetical protein